MISLEHEIEKRQRIIDEKEQKVAEATRAVVDAEHDVNMVARQLAELVAKRDTLTAHLTAMRKALEEAKAIDVSKIEAELEMLNGILGEHHEEVAPVEEVAAEPVVEEPVVIPEVVAEPVIEPVAEPVIEYVPEEPAFVAEPVIEEQPVEVHQEAHKVNGDPFGGVIDRINF